jgi:cell division protein ZapE
LKPSEIYLSKVAQEELIHDEKQLALLQNMDVLQNQITRRSTRWFYKEQIKGLYIKGEVGRGKTQLMDIFFESLDIKKKKRLHFHRFMQKLHQDLDDLSGQIDPVQLAAVNLARDTEVLCFDEFFVEDIGDAMLLARFMEKLFKLPVSLVATSNSSPDDLYKNGLHRDRFLPAIQAINDNCEVYELNSNQDYRLRTLEQQEIFILSKDDSGNEKILKIFNELTQNLYEEGRNVEVLGRKIESLRLSKGLVWFSFVELCGGFRSAKDYIELCVEFHTIFVSGIPLLDSHRDDSTRRFIALVDECYERNVNLILSSEAQAKDMYSGKKMEEPFKRTISRLEEMRSREYLSKPHLA